MLGYKLESNDFQGAINDCDDAIYLDPNNQSDYIIRAIAKSKLGKLAEGIEDFDNYEGATAKLELAETELEGESGTPIDGRRYQTTLWRNEADTVARWSDV